MTPYDRDFVVHMAESCEASLHLAAACREEGLVHEAEGFEQDAVNFASYALAVAEGRA